MELKKKVIVLGLKRYDFTNDNGEQVKGTSIWYYDLEATNEENAIGVLPQKATFPHEAFEIHRDNNFPCEAEAILKLDLAKGRIKVGAFQFPIKK